MPRLSNKKLAKKAAAAKVRKLAKKGVTAAPKAKGKSR